MRSATALRAAGRRARNNSHAPTGRLAEVRVGGCNSNFPGRPAPRGGAARANKEGLRGGKRRCAFVIEAAFAAPRRIWGLPAAFQRFPAPGLSPGGCGEPRIVAARVTPRVPDTAARPRYRNASRSTPQRGGMRRVCGKGEGRGLFRRWRLSFQWLLRARSCHQAMTAECIARRGLSQKRNWSSLSRGTHRVAPAGSQRDQEQTQSCFPERALCGRLN